MPAVSSTRPAPSAGRFRAAVLIAWLTGCGVTFVALYAEILGIYTDVPLLWISLYVMLFLGFPLARQPFRRRRPSASTGEETGQRTGSLPGRWLADSPENSQQLGRPRLAAFAGAACVGVVSILLSLHAARMFGDLPPAYHDEFSYLFQAETFLAGRTWFPSHPLAAPLFDQMHVLNEGRFASRYFPATGAWIAPFLAMGHPLWGHWLAGGLTAMFVFAAGRELHSNGAGLLAGLVTALSPGLILFSNLLLAHHPGLVGLSLFVWCWLRQLRTGRDRDGVLAGTGLAFAMLARPMTAFAIGLPFGVWTAVRLVRGWRQRKLRRPDGAEAGSVFGAVSISRHPLRETVSLAGPLVAGLVVLMLYSGSITGEVLKTPYQVYTDTYTPRHVYGFYNVTRGEQRLGPRVIAQYDEWAEELTPELAAQNAFVRLLASLQLTLGLIPLAMTAAAWMVLVPLSSIRLWLVAGAILSLHVAHIPYWFAGIMQWHYVMESSILWALLFGVVTVTLCRQWIADRRLLLPAWWCGLAAVAVAGNLISVEALSARSLLSRGVADIRFSRLKHAAFRELIDREVTSRPALVLVRADPADRHIEYVNNPPSLNAPVLTGHWLPEEFSISDLRQLFSGRTLYLFDAEQGALRRLRAR